MSERTAWPFPAQRDATLTRIDRVLDEHLALLAALKQANVLLASVSLLDIDIPAKRLAAHAAKENRELIRRVESQ